MNQVRISKNNLNLLNNLKLYIMFLAHFSKRMILERLFPLHFQLFLFSLVVFTVALLLRGRYWCHLPATELVPDSQLLVEEVKLLSVVEGKIECAAPTKLIATENPGKIPILKARDPIKQVNLYCSNRLQATLFTWIWQEYSQFRLGILFKFK